VLVEPAGDQDGELVGTTETAMLINRGRPVGVWICKPLEWPIIGCPRRLRYDKLRFMSMNGSREKWWQHCSAEIRFLPMSARTVR
jgi:hypothetical protein